MIEAARVRAAPPLAAHRGRRSIRRPRRGQGADACGIVAAGLGRGRHVYVLADASVAGLAPAGWAARAVALYRRLKADALVAEVNQGGDMVRAVIRAGRRGACRCARVRATRGKWLRAEPVAALYEQGRVRHVDRRCRRWRTRCATSASTGCRPAARPTGSTRWSGR